MTNDIFSFWSLVGPNDRIHPADKGVLTSNKHPFDLTCLPSCFMGPLRTAPVVFLYSSPGYKQEIDIAEADDPEIQQLYFRQRTGRECLLGPQLAGWWSWLRRTIGSFGDLETIRSRVAILDLCVYKSETASSDRLLKRLPSTHVVLRWASDVLFTQAKTGQRVVVCMRRHRNWPLHPVSGSLFAPRTNQGGHMLRRAPYGEERERVLRAVRNALDTPTPNWGL